MELPPDITDPSALPIPQAPPIGAPEPIFAGQRNPYVPPIVEHRPRRATGPTKRLRFEPYVGGEDSTRLYVSVGTVRFLELPPDQTGGIDPFEEEEEDVPVYVIPVTPTIDGNPIDAATPPYFDISARTSCSLWMLHSRGASSGTVRIEMHDLDETEPDIPDGWTAELMSKLTFDTASGGEKSIATKNGRIESDMMVPVKHGSPLDSSESFPSGSSSEESWDGGSSQSSNADGCPDFNINATWHNKPDNYPDSGEVLVGVRIEYNLQNIPIVACERVMIAARLVGAEMIPRPGTGFVPGATGWVGKVVGTSRGTLDILGKFDFAKECGTANLLDFQVISEGVDPDDSGDPCNTTYGPCNFECCWPPLESDEDSCSCGSQTVFVPYTP